MIDKQSNHSCSGYLLSENFFYALPQNHPKEMVYLCSLITVVEYNILPVPVFYPLHCVVKYLRKNQTSSLKEEVYTHYYPSAQEFWLSNSLCVPITGFTKCEIAKFNSTQNVLYVEINIKK